MSRSLSPPFVVLFPFSTTRRKPMASCPQNLWLMLPEAFWSLIIPFVSDDDSTNLAEVFPNVAIEIKTFNYSTRSTYQQLDLLTRCPRVNKLIVNKDVETDILMDVVAEINQKIESIDSTGSPCFANVLRTKYIKKLWRMKCPVDHFKDTIPFHRELAS